MNNKEEALRPHLGAKLKMDAVKKTIEYGIKKGYSVTDLDNKINTAKWAKGLKIPEGDMEKVSKGISKLVTDNTGKSSVTKSLADFSESGIENLTAKIMEKMPKNGKTKASPAPTSAHQPTERATIIDIIRLPEGKQSIEMDRIGMRLLKNDETAGHKKWPNAHNNRDKNGQYGRFLKVIQTVTKNLGEEFTTLSREEAEKKLSQAFSGLQRKIERETRSEVAETDLQSYLNWVSFKIGKVTNLEAGTITQTDRDSALAFMQRRGYEPHEALSVATDADWEPMGEATAEPEAESSEDFEEEFSSEEVEEDFS